jgi:hypothetical protein
VVPESALESEPHANALAGPGRRLRFIPDSAGPPSPRRNQARRTNLRPSTLMALSRPLGVTIDYLVDDGQSAQTMLNHSAFPYRADHQFRTMMGSFLAEGVERSEALLAVTTGPNIELLRQHLAGDARSVEFVDSRSFTARRSPPFRRIGPLPRTTSGAAPRGYESLVSRCGRRGPTSRFASGPGTSRCSSSSPPRLR